MTDKKPSIYGYMRAYPGTSEAEVMENELKLFRWAQLEGYDLAVIYQEEEEGSISVLTELVEQLKLTDDPSVVVPSIQHFGTSRVLQNHLWAYVVHCADAELYEASDQ